MSAEAILAIDGPAGAGKSTVSKRVADALGLEMLDTGAMYRAVTLAALQGDVPLDSSLACSEIAARVVIELRADTTWLDGVDVSAAIRTPEVTRAVSVVSAHAGVRSALVAHQRQWAGTRTAGVVEGRDIGSVVFPESRCKIFLSASAAERARRRQIDEVDAGRTVTIDELVADIERRDRLDSNRPVSPLTQAEDAQAVDTTGRTIDDVVDEIVMRYRVANPPGDVAEAST